MAARVGKIIERWISRAERHWILIVIMVLAVGSNLVWIFLDGSPFLWDMASHADRALLFSELIRGNFWREILSFEVIYPPLTYLVSAVFFLILGPDSDAPQISLLVYVIIYLVSLYVGAWTFFRHRLAAVMVTATGIFPPLLSHFSRIYDLDFPLTALVIAAVICLVRSNFFKDRFWSILTGIFIGGAILTKFTAIIFFIGPFIWCFWYGGKKIRHGWINILSAIVIISALNGPWYYLHGQEILSSKEGTQNNVFSVPFENVWSWGNAIYYPVKAGLGFSWPILGLIILGMACLFWRNRRAGVLIVLSIFLPYLLFTFWLISKESRYFLPVYPFLALGIGGLIYIKKYRLGYLLLGMAVVFGVLIWTEVSWNVRILSPQIQEKAFLTTTYGYPPVRPKDPKFGLTYPSRYAQSVSEIPAIIKADLETRPLGHAPKIVVVPNSIYLNARQIQYDCRLGGLRSREKELDFSLSQAVRFPQWRKDIVKADYLITKTGDQGPLVFGPALPEVAKEELKDQSAIFNKFSLLREIMILTLEDDIQVVRVYRRQGAAVY